MLSLGLALGINAAILIVAAASLTGLGMDVASLEEAHRAMGLVLGAGAAFAFALALYAAGQSSAITGLIAGRMLTRGFRGRESSAWLRGLGMRVGALALAFALLLWRGDGGPDGLLVSSQVVLSLALPFVLVPLLAVVGRRDLMGRFALGPAALASAGAATAVIVGLDLYLLWTVAIG